MDRRSVLVSSRNTHSTQRRPGDPVRGTHLRCTGYHSNDYFWPGSRYFPTEELKEKTKTLVPKATSYHGTPSQPCAELAQCDNVFRLARRFTNPTTKTLWWAFPRDPKGAKVFRRRSRWPPGYNLQRPFETNDHRWRPTSSSSSTPKTR